MMQDIEAVKNHCGRGRQPSWWPMPHFYKLGFPGALEENRGREQEQVRAGDLLASLGAL